MKHSDDYIESEGTLRAQYEERREHWHDTPDPRSTYRLKFYIPQLDCTRTEDITAYSLEEAKQTVKDQWSLCGVSIKSDDIEYIRPEKEPTDA